MTSAPGPVVAAGKVLASIEDAGGHRCVDIFQRADGSFGFAQYRSESDGDRRWQRLGGDPQRAFASASEALDVAKAQIDWIDRAEVWRW